MSPDQQIEINGYKVEEFYWAGKTVVYVDNVAVTTSYRDTIADLQAHRRPAYKTLTPSTDTKPKN